MSYFDHPYISNSDIKNFKKQIGLAREDPENLQEIFDLGTLIHAMILEPHKADRNNENFELAMRMSKSFFADNQLRAFVSGKDFRSELGYYERVQVGPFKFNSRCKMDGARPLIKTMLEIKGLKVSNYHDFREALQRYDYDQAAVQYMLTGEMDMALIVGLSKTKPEMKPMKWLVKKHDDFYAVGEQKLIDSLELIEGYSPEDIQRV